MHNGLRPALNRITTSGGTIYLSPGDFAIIYDVNPFTTRASTAVVRASPSWAARTPLRLYRLGILSHHHGPVRKSPKVIVNGPDPGDLGTNEDAEADLDVEWSGAVATNATIIFVTSPIDRYDGRGGPVGPVYRRQQDSAR